MPRHTHPRPRNKHLRAETRYQRRRYIAKRWRAAKRLYGDDFWLSRRLSEPGPVTSAQYEFRHRLRQVGPMVFVHPEVARRLPTWLWWARQWPFSLEPGRFARNPFNTCECWDCGGWKRDDPRRTREKREWRREAWAEATDAGEGATIAGPALRRVDRHSPK